MGSGSKLLPLTRKRATPNVGTQTGSICITEYVVSAIPPSSNCCEFEDTYRVSLRALRIMGTSHVIVASLTQNPLDLHCLSSVTGSKN